MPEQRLLLSERAEGAGPGSRRRPWASSSWHIDLNFSSLKPRVLLVGVRTNNIGDISADQFG